MGGKDPKPSPTNEPPTTPPPLNSKSEGVATSGQDETAGTSGSSVNNSIQSHVQSDKLWDYGTDFPTFSGKIFKRKDASQIAWLNRYTPPSKMSSCDAWKDVSTLCAVRDGNQASGMGSESRTHGAAGGSVESESDHNRRTDEGSTSGSHPDHLDTGTDGCHKQTIATQQDGSEPSTGREDTLCAVRDGNQASGMGSESRTHGAAGGSVESESDHNRRTDEGSTSGSHPDHLDTGTDGCHKQTIATQQDGSEPSTGREDTLCAVRDGNQASGMGSESRTHGAAGGSVKSETDHNRRTDEGSTSGSHPDHLDTGIDGCHKQTIVTQQDGSEPSTGREDTLCAVRDGNQASGMGSESRTHGAASGSVKSETDHNRRTDEGSTSGSHPDHLDTGIDGCHKQTIATQQDGSEPSAGREEDTYPRGWTSWDGCSLLSHLIDDIYPASRFGELRQNPNFGQQFDHAPHGVVSSGQESPPLSGVIPLKTEESQIACRRQADPSTLPSEMSSSHAGQDPSQVGPSNMWIQHLLESYPHQSSFGNLQMPPHDPQERSDLDVALQSMLLRQQLSFRSTHIPYQGPAAQGCIFVDPTQAEMNKLVWGMCIGHPLDPNIATQASSLELPHFRLTHLPSASVLSNAPRQPLGVGCALCGNDLAFEPAGHPSSSVVEKKCGHHFHVGCLVFVYGDFVLSDDFPCNACERR